MECIVASVLWIVWCSLHSAMISAAVKGFMEQYLGYAFRYYRLFYNAVSVLTVIPVFLYENSVESRWLWRWEGLFAAMPCALITIGAVLFFAGARQYDGLQLLGIRQIREHQAFYGRHSDGELSTAGIHRLIRHPWYTGGILVVWARDLSELSLVVNVILTGYFIIGAYLEERKLVREFGQTYQCYREQVSMFLPFKWLQSVLRGGH